MFKISYFLPQEITHLVVFLCIAACRRSSEEEVLGLADDAQGHAEGATLLVSKAFTSHDMLYNDPPYYEKKNKGIPDVVSADQSLSLFFYDGLEKNI